MKNRFDDAVDWVTENFVLRYWNALVGVVFGLLILLPFNLFVYGVSTALLLAGLTFVIATAIMVGTIELVKLWERSL